MVKRKHPQAVCEACPLFEYGEYVPSCGPAKATLAIVGEAPGVNESRIGKPFVGQSGKLVDVLLKHNGIERDKTFLTNACLCREPSGDNPPKDAIAACKPRLESELDGHEIKTVVAMGNYAAEAVLGKNGITKLRIGPPKEAKGRKVICTIHPAAALRAPDNFPFILKDFSKINGKQVTWIPPQFVVAETVSQALEFLHQIDNRNPKRLVIDIEVGIEKDQEFGHANEHDMLCVGIAYDKAKVLVLSEEVMRSDAVLDRLAQLLNKYPVGAQNGKFDCAGLYIHCGPIRLSYDSMLDSYVLDERPGIHDLEQMGVEELGTPSWKQVLNQYKKPGESYAVIPRYVLYKYNAYDCSVTWDLIELFLSRMDKQEYKDTFYLLQGKMVPGKRLRDVQDFLCEVSNELMFVELAGMAVDPDYIDELSFKLQRQIAILEKSINEILPWVKDEEGFPEQKQYDKKMEGVNPRSPKQLLQVFKDFGIYTQSTDADTCKRIIEVKGPDSPIGKFCVKLLEHRGESKNYGTYVEGTRKRILAGTDRVYTSFLLHGTTEGRLSSRNPNLQNIPRKSAIRRLFVPTKATSIFVQGDYSQAELRILCWLAGDTYFTPIFNEGLRDVFDELSENVLFPQYPKKIDESRFLEISQTDAFKNLVQEWDSLIWQIAYKEFFKQVRSKWVKPFVYGLAYGRTEYGIAGDIEIGLSVDEARVIMNKFMAVIPEIVQWQKDIKKIIEKGNDLVTPFGRHRRFHLLTKQNYEDVMKSGLAFVPASTSSDVCLRAFTRIRPELAKKKLAVVRNLVHDSIIAECNENDAEEVGQIMKRHMIDSAHELVGDFIKFAVDIETGHSWGDLS